MEVGGELCGKDVCMTALSADTLLCAGYFVIRPYALNNGRRLLSVATGDEEEPGLSLLGQWAVSYVEMAPEERWNDAAARGVAGHDIAAIMAWLDPHRLKDYQWPNVFMSLACAHAFCAAFTHVTHDSVIVGLGLAPADRDALLAASPSASETGVYTLLERRVPLVGGAPAGVDVLGFDDGWFYSWRHAWRLLGADPTTDAGVSFNRWGLVETSEDIATIMDVVTSEGDPFENESIWLPYHVVRYDRVLPDAESV